MLIRHLRLLIRGTAFTDSQIFKLKYWIKGNAMLYTSDHQPLLMNDLELPDRSIDTPMNIESLAAQFGLQPKALAAILQSSCL